MKRQTVSLDGFTVIISLTLNQRVDGSSPSGGTLISFRVNSRDDAPSSFLSLQTIALSFQHANEAGQNNLKWLSGPSCGRAWIRWRLGTVRRLSVWAGSAVMDVRGLW